MSMLATLLRMTGPAREPEVLSAGDILSVPVPARQPLPPATDEEMSKPGLKPRTLHDLSRLNDVKDAIDSAIEIGIDPEPEWIEEMHDLMDRLGMDET